MSTHERFCVIPPVVLPEHLILPKVCRVYKVDGAVIGIQHDKTAILLADETVEAVRSHAIAVCIVDSWVIGFDLGKGAALVLACYDPETRRRGDEPD